MAVPILEGRLFSILDFDIENRPLTYWTPDRPSAEVTAIAWAFVDKPEDVQARLLGQVSAREMLEDFVRAYNEADMVTGHYISRHDLPIINGALLELGMPSLGPKLVQDTSTLLVKKGDLPTSQEALAQMLGVSISKVHMTQPDWREANRLTYHGLAKTYDRVVEDVKQNMEMRKELLRRKLLKPPRVWRP